MPARYAEVEAKDDSMEKRLVKAAYGYEVLFFGRLRGLDWETLLVDLIMWQKICFAFFRDNRELWKMVRGPVDEYVCAYILMTLFACRY